MERARPLPALTSLRFFAASAIVVQHSTLFFGGGDLGLQKAVSLFFILSGFILAYVYPSLSEIGAGRFWWLRFARIWPAHVASLLVCLALLVCRSRPIFADPVNARALFANLSMVHAWIPVHAVNLSFNAVSWSISTEFAFYLLFPLLIREWERTWHRKLAGALLLLAGMIGFATFCSVTLDAGPRHDVVLSLVYISPATRLFEFVLGMVVAHLWRRCRRIYRPPAWVANATEASAVVLALLAFAAHLPLDHWLGEHGPTPAWLPLLIWLRRAGLSCVPFALLIGVLALERGMIARWLSHPLLVRLGESSYALYLLHLSFAWFAVDQLARHPSLGTVSIYATYWAVCLLSAYLMWLLVERPARRWLVNCWPVPAPATIAEPIRIKHSRWVILDGKAMPEEVSSMPAEFAEATND